MFASQFRADEVGAPLPDDPRAGVRLLLGDDPRADGWWAGDAMAELSCRLPPRVAGATLPARDGQGPGDAVPAGAGVAQTSLGGRGSASFLEQLAPGAGLAAVLELLDPALLSPAEPDDSPLDDAALVEAVAAWERLAAWAHLGAALTAAVLSRRTSMNPHWQLPAPTRTCVAGDGLAMRLGWSRPAANRLVRDGRALGNELLLVADAVRDGLIDTPKMRVLTDRLHDRPDQLAWPVQEAVLTEAATRTPTQLAADIDRALLAIDPDDAARRLPRAMATRHVCHPRRLPDGMAGLWAVLPAVDAARIDATLEATARTARAVGDPRTLDQLRAGTLTDLATGQALLAGSAVAMSVPAPTCGKAAANEGDDDPVPDPPAGAEDRPRERAAPGIRIPSVRIDVTVALSTLLGLDESPGELAGLGPVPAEQARALAAGGVWRRLVTDPLTGTVLDVGRTRYRPPAALADHVIARDHQCAAPGCTVPGHSCDLDHTTDYHATPANGSPHRGTTSADNLGPLSHRCHRLKTDGGFTLLQVAPGVFEWHTPAGLAYRVTPGHHGRTQRLDKPTRSSYPDHPPF